MAPRRKDISLCIYPSVKNTQMPVTEGQVIFASAPLPLPRHQCYFCFWYLKVKADSLPAGHVCQSLSLNTCLISPGQNSSPRQSVIVVKYLTVISRSKQTAHLHTSVHHCCQILDISRSDSSHRSICLSLLLNTCLRSWGQSRQLT